MIGYDGYDFPQFMRRFESAPADFMGGRAYTRTWAERYPERLSYVTTLFHPRVPGWLELLVEELSAGAIGVKIFPAYLRLAPDAPEIRAAFDLLGERSRAAMFGFEDTSPPETPTLSEYYEAIGRLAVDYPGVPIQLNHGANAAPDGEEFAVLRQMVAACPNVLVSTSVLGGPMMDWADEWRYPFPRYLATLARYAEAHAVRAARLGDRLALVRGLGQVPAAPPGDRRSRARSRRRRPSASTSAATRSGTGGSLSPFASELLEPDVLVEPRVTVDDLEPVLDRLPCVRIRQPLLGPLVDPRRGVDLPDDDVVRAAQAPRSADREHRAILGVRARPVRVRSLDRLAEALRIETPGLRE